MSLVEFSTRRRVTVAMVTVTFVIFGVIALFNLKVNLLPDLSYPTLTVRTEYTGAAPMEIETLISEPVEEAVGVVKNLRKLRSVSRTGQSDVVLEFAWGTDMDQASLEVRDKLEVLRLPLEAKQPVLLRFNPSTEPVMRLVLASTETTPGSEQAGLMRLRRHAEEELKKRLEPVSGVAAVKVAGGLEDEVQVLIDQDRLAQLNLDVNTVIERLRLENVNISGGRIEEGSQRYLVRTVNQFTGLDQMRELLVANVDGVPVRLRDVATVTQGYKEREAIIRLGGGEAVELAIYKEGDANTVAVADAIKAALERLRDELPAGSTLTTIEDQSVFIEAALSEVKKEALMGGVFAILLIFFFLRDGWSTFVIGLSLPVSIIATFFFMGQFGLNLNVMSLAGLALATGMVVDDSIVVLESIAKARERGLGVLEAAVVGTQEVSMAVVASTLTTVAVFFPLVFVQGVAGQLFKDQALTVSIALVISLVVSLTLIPMLSALKAKSPMAFAATPGGDSPATPPWRLMLAQVRELFFLPFQKIGAAFGRSGLRGVVASLVALVLAVVWVFCLVLLLLAVPVAFLLPWALSALSWLVVLVARVLAIGGRGLGWVGGWVLKPYDWAEAGYHRLLPKALSNPLPVLGSAGIAFGLALFVASTLGTDLIPQFAQDRFEMTAKLPPGTQLRDTDALVKQVQLVHGEDEGVQALYGVSGSGTRLDANPTESGENIAKLTVVMGGDFGRDSEARQTERMRATMAQYPDVQVKFGRPQLFSFSTPLEIELRGQDLVAVEQAGRKLAAMMEGSDSFADVKSTVEQGFPEIQIRFDQERAAALGLTSRQIADQVVRKVRGEVATRYSFRDRKIDVLVRAQEADRESLESIRKIIVNPQSDRPVTLDAVADVVATVGPSEINRVDQIRVAIVSANLRDIDLGTAVQQVRDMVAADPLGAEVRMHIGGQGEELDASISSLIFALSLAIFLVYLVMASQFESLLHPFVIMFTIPLAMVGAVMALWLSGSPVSVVVFIGLILLVGIVVKNAIILIDKVNQLREQGVAKDEAIMQGAYSRLRPIIMTTATTLFGFAPLAFFGGEGAEVRAPMAITVIGGLAVSTLLTLVVIPVMYKLMDRKSDASYVERGQRASALERLRAATAMGDAT
ncbi:MAG TPA: efflux RND transporter permease subunit [Arenimonas sp.]|uniref:efflux RND transporter permease subunit n=1 Tax=Arenimonas sp. TaxID=1872635 RepID=UPI002D803C68|nr:efflux RND transporter permease subunit [Arenimonas sp.]HEU0153578.1 efflux RND transporter permease subunit [Arenimonas sp.]